jgi:flagellar hook-associated protein 1
MSLTQALSAALSGLQVSQTSLGLVAANVANADTPGYTRKVIDQVTAADGTSVNIASIQRQLDQYVQTQLRTENAGATYADTRAQMYSDLQDIYGQPGADTSLETVYNNFTDALQALSTSPSDPSAQNDVVSTAQLLTQQLNQMTDSIQGLREQAENDISNGVTQANQAMSQIAALNQQITAAPQGSEQATTLMDQRDSYIDQLSQLMDIRVSQGGGNQVSVSTSSGVQLVSGTQASQLSFDAQGTMTPNSQWSADPSQCSVGTITLTTPNGNSVDLIQSNAIRSGQIAADLQMRDHDLVQAQNQLDGIAAGMASALSDTTMDGSAVTAGTQNGFDVDIGDLSAGNTVTVTYTDSSSVQHAVTLMRVDDPSALPLSNSATIDPNDTVVGIDFSGGMSSVISQINSALGSAGMVASNPSGSTLEILDDGSGTATVNSVSTTTTATSLTGGVALPMFTDGSEPYTGAVTSAGSEMVGLAGRIAVNPDLADDPSSLAVYQSGTAAGDNTRPNFIYQQLTSASIAFSPNTGIGTAAAPYSSSITTFLQQVISQQGEAASAASSLQQGQDVVLSSLQQRFNDSSGVNVDQEMANLLTLQNSYAANAHVLSAVNTMLDTLMQMGT